MTETNSKARFRFERDRFTFEIDGYLDAFYPDAAAERREWIERVLGALQPGIDLDRVRDVLDEAAFVWHLVRVAARQQKDARELDRARTTIADVLKALETGEDAEHLNALREIISTLDAKLTDVPLRRASRGRPQDHVTYLQNELKALRVGKEDRKALADALFLEGSISTKLSTDS